MKKIFCIIIALLGLGVLVLLVWLSLAKGSLYVDSNINGAQFMFNNTVYYAPVEIKNIKPGKYKITAHNTDYQDEFLEVEIKGLSITKTKLKMKPLTNIEKLILTEEKKWGNYFLKKSTNVNKEVLERKEKYPLSSFLPQRFDLVVFDYIVNSGGSVSYVVWPLLKKEYQKQDYEQRINDFIVSKGFNPKNIDISWE